MLLIVCAAVALGVGRLRYHEVDEIKASVRRGLNDRRLRASHNIRVRRAVRAMSNAQSIGAFFDAVRVLLEVGEFVYARVQLGDGPGGRSSAEALLARDAEGSRRHRLVIEDGFVCWSWERGDVGEVVSHLGPLWTLRLPLSTERGTWGYINLYRGLDSDETSSKNYLCHLFQRDTGPRPRESSPRRLWKRRATMRPCRSSTVRATKSARQTCRGRACPCPPWLD